jgi:hypothetical protein
MAISKTSAVAFLSISGFIMGYIITALISRWMSARRTLSPIITRIIRRGLVSPRSSQSSFIKSPKDSDSMSGNAGS